MQTLVIGGKMEGKKITKYIIEFTEKEYLMLYYRLVGSRKNNKHKEAHEDLTELIDKLAHYL